MTTQTIPSDVVSLPAAAKSSHAPRFVVQVVFEGSGIVRTLERPAALESATSRQCDVIRLGQQLQVEHKAGFDAFDQLALEVAMDDTAASEVARGRRWVAGAFGDGDLASLRLAAGLSQSDLAARCGIEQPHVSRYESGRHEPMVSLVSKMAAALDVSMEEVFVAWGRSRAKQQPQVQTEGEQR